MNIPYRPTGPGYAAVVLDSLYKVRKSIVYTG